MNINEQNSSQLMTRAHSFINRTPHTVLTINKIYGWQNIIENINKNISNKLLKNNTNGKQQQNSKNITNVRCLRIQFCQLYSKQSKNEQKTTQNKLNKCNDTQIQTYKLQIPKIIVNKLFIHLSKLVITKCNMQHINMISQQQKQCNIFPNMQQIDISKNKLKQFPTFIYNCIKLTKIDISSNYIQLIPTQLAIMINLKHIKILDNPIQKISHLLLKQVSNDNKILQIQWKLNILTDIRSNEVGQTVPSMRTTLTQGDQQHIQAQEIQNYLTLSNNIHISNISTPILSPTALPHSLQNYINVKQTVLQKMKKYMQTNDRLIEEQMHVLIIDQNITYLKYVEEIINQSMCRNYIQLAFKNRKYLSLDFLLAKYRQFQYKIMEQKSMNEKFKEKQLQKIYNKTIMNKQKIKQKKQDKQNNSMLVGRKKIKMLTIKTSLQRQKLPQFHLNNIKNQKQNEKHSEGYKNTLNLKSIARTTKSIVTQNFIDNINFKISMPKNIKNEYENDQTHTKYGNMHININNEADNEDEINNIQQTNRQHKNNNQIVKQLVIQKLSSYNTSHIQHINISSLQQVTIDQFIWLLNELQFVENCKVKLQNNNNIFVQVFQMKNIQIIVNNIIKNQDDFQYIINLVSYKKAIKMLIMYSDIQFLKAYNFKSIFILKSILKLDDISLIKRIQQKYYNFFIALFNNLTFYQKLHSLTSLYSNANQSMLKSATNSYCQKVSWKLLLSPNYKIYKYLYKLQKKNIKNQLNTNIKNWHYPEYHNRQSLIYFNHNQTQNNKMIKQYQQFQTNFLQKQIKKVQFRPINPVYTLSIAKKIYMKVLDDAQNSVRSLGKTRQKDKSKLLRKQSKDSSIYMQQSYRELSNNASMHHINLFKSIPASPLHRQATERQYNQSSNQKFQNNYRYTRKNSITIISKQKNKIKPAASKSKDGKKIGISLCSNSVSSIKPIESIQNVNKTERAINRTVYLDLSKSGKTPMSYIDLLNSPTSENKNLEAFIDSQPIICSTFDTN